MMVLVSGKELGNHAQAAAAAAASSVDVTRETLASFVAKPSTSALLDDDAEDEEDGDVFGEDCCELCIALPPPLAVLGSRRCSGLTGCRRSVLLVDADDNGSVWRYWW